MWLAWETDVDVIVHVWRAHLAPPVFYIWEAKEPKRNVQIRIGVSFNFGCVQRLLKALDQLCRAMHGRS